MWAALMFLFPLIGAVCYVHSSRFAIISQIRIRAQLTSLVYRKALALSSRCTKHCNACTNMRPLLRDFRCAIQTPPAGSVPSRLCVCLMCNVLPTASVQAGCMPHGQKGDLVLKGALQNCMQLCRRCLSLKFC